MSEASSGPELDLLLPGNIIEFADITELAAFEDFVARVVDSRHNPVLWAARPALRDLIRPPKFNGTIADITLEVMANPYERLLDARERGWELPMLGRIKRSSELGKGDIPNYRGFIFTAKPKSSRPGELGQIQAELWYYPLPSYRVSKREQHYHHHRTGEAIRRIVTKPKVETERFITHDETARRIGFSVLRQAMTHPISTPMGGQQKT